MSVPAAATGIPHSKVIWACPDEARGPGACFRPRSFRRPRSERDSGGGRRNPGRSESVAPIGWSLEGSMARTTHTNRSCCPTSRERRRLRGDERYPIELHAYLLLQEPRGGGGGDIHCAAVRQRLHRMMCSARAVASSNSGPGTRSAPARDPTSDMSPARRRACGRLADCSAPSHPWPGSPGWSRSVDRCRYPPRTPRPPARGSAPAEPPANRSKWWNPPRAGWCCRSGARSGCDRRLSRRSRSGDGACHPRRAPRTGRLRRPRPSPAAAWIPAGRCCGSTRPHRNPPPVAGDTGGLIGAGAPR